MDNEEIRTEAEQPAAAPPPESTTGTTTKTTEPNLADELREFGTQIASVFHFARTSPRGKEVEQQLTAAWRDVEKGVNTAITKAQSSDIKGTVQGTAQYAADEAQSGLARGLRSLNQWMSQKLRQLETDASFKATHGTGGDEVADRFNNAPVFGHDIHVPAAHVTVTPDEKAVNADNPINDRFNP